MLKNVLALGTVNGILCRDTPVGNHWSDFKTPVTASTRSVCVNFVVRCLCAKPIKRTAGASVNQQDASFLRIAASVKALQLKCCGYKNNRVEVRSNAKSFLGRIHLALL